MTNRNPRWTAALRTLKASRTLPRPVREECSRLSAGNLSAWQGRSGRRYVVRVVAALDEAEPAVALAVTRDPLGLATILAVGIVPGFVPPADAEELHVHRLAETDGDRGAVAADLAPMMPADALAALVAFYSEPGAWTRRGDGDLEETMYKLIGNPDEAGVSEAEGERRSDLIQAVCNACGCDVTAFSDVAWDQRAVVAVLQAGLNHLA